MAPVLFRPLIFVGRAGRAVFGGPSEGLPGRGIVAAMVELVERDEWVYQIAVSQI